MSVALQQAVEEATTWHLLPIRMREIRLPVGEMSKTLRRTKKAESVFVGILQENTTRGGTLQSTFQGYESPLYGQELF